MLAYPNRLIITIVFISVVSFLSAHTDKYRCMWRDDPATTMTVGWNQISGHSPVLHYGETDYGMDAMAYGQAQSPDRQVMAKGMQNHFVRLTGLYPNTVYYFVIVDSEGVSQVMSFRTAPDHPHERLSIIAGGDSRNHRTGRRNANQLVRKLRPHCVMFGGDMTGSDRSREWKGWFDDWQHTIGKDGRITPIIVTRGNHEYSNKTLVDLFDVRNDKIYYALNLGGDLLRIYTLNSLIASGGNQKYWLEQDLKDHQHMVWKFAQYHFAIRPHTRSKKERNGQYQNWALAFHKYQVNMVVESDAHVVKTTWPVRPLSGAGNDEGFIRDDEEGTVYVGEGCWGAPLRRSNDIKAWTRNSGSFNQFKWIFVDQDKIEIRTVKTDNAEMVDDVDPYDVFSPPAGLSIWQPSNGPVITIPRRHSTVDYLATASIQKMVPFTNTFPGSNLGSTKSNTVSSTKVHPVIKEKEVIEKKEIREVVKKEAVPEVEITECVASLSSTEIAISWKTKNETNNRVQYELQKTQDGSDYKAIAQLKSAGIVSGEMNSYRILDSFQDLGSEQLAYRLKKTNLDGKISFHPVNKISEVLNEWQQFKKIIPDPNSGLIKVRYELENPSDVNIRLITLSKKEITQSEYKNQKSGNYQRSIDLTQIPEGLYLLMIEVNQEVKHRYHVYKKV